jgi:hypothetical protein
MLKLLLLATLIALLGRMVSDLWRAWVASRLRPQAPPSASAGPPTELVRCTRCGAYAPVPSRERTARAFLCRGCQVAGE